MDPFWKLEAGLRRVAYSPLYASITGDVVTGVLLSQLVYWFRPTKAGKARLTIYREGVRWLAKSRSEMMEDTGLTDNQLRRSMNVLADLGLVISEVHLFQGKTVPHLYLDVSRLNSMVQTLLSEESESLKPRPRSSGFNVAGSVVLTKPSLPEITTETTTETFARERATAVNVDPPDKGGEEDHKVLKVNFRKDPQMTADEILKSRAENKEDKLMVKSGTNALAILWKKRLSTLQEGAFVKALTGQDMGQLKLLAQRLGDDAGRVLDWALQNWAQFAFETKQTYGLTATPEKPVIGFLLKYHDVAVQLSAGPTKAKAVASNGGWSTTQMGGVVSTIPAPASGVKPEAGIVSKDDVKAALAKLKASKGSSS